MIAWIHENAAWLKEQAAGLGGIVALLFLGAVVFAAERDGDDSEIG
jgi:hypothetical protein